METAFDQQEQATEPISLDRLADVSPYAAGLFVLREFIRSELAALGPAPSESLSH